MKPKLAYALIAFGVSAFITQTLPAAQVLAVSSNGKWDMEYEPYGNVNALAAKALAACKAKGGTDPKIVWSEATNVGGGGASMYKGAIAISDNGSGTIVGWSFAHWDRRGHPDVIKMALNDCRKKGGQNPKTVAHW
jgi:hypothetical protein